MKIATWVQQTLYAHEFIGSSFQLGLRATLSKNMKIDYTMFLCIFILLMVLVTQLYPKLPSATPISISKDANMSPRDSTTCLNIVTTRVDMCITLLNWRVVFMDPVIFSRIKPMDGKIPMLKTKSQVRATKCNSLVE